MLAHRLIEASIKFSSSRPLALGFALMPVIRDSAGHISIVTRCKRLLFASKNRRNAALGHYLVPDTRRSIAKAAEARDRLYWHPAM
jgi:hypothetical protein